MLKISFFTHLYSADISAAHLFIKSMSCIITIIFNNTSIEYMCQNCIRREKLTVPYINPIKIYPIDIHNY